MTTHLEEFGKQYEKMVADVDRELDSDRRFFERRPRRSYRLRRAFSNEGAALTFAMPNLGSLPGRALFVAVYQLEPGLRLRFPFTAPSNIEVDLSDDDAKAAFAFVTKSKSGPDYVERMKGEGSRQKASRRA